MTATALAQGETVDCINCDGNGSTGVRNYGRHAVHEYIERPCTCCGGTGLVDAEFISTCSSCTAKYWTGDGCSHLNELCDECRPECADCRQDARDDASEAACAAFMGGRS